MARRSAWGRTSTRRAAWRSGDTGSLLRWFQLLIERYRECPELAWGDYTVLDNGHHAVLAHRCDVDGATVVVAHNLCDTAVDVELTLTGLEDQELTDLPEDASVKSQ
ncbi:alpha-glucosidase C-terminal domain-containing protein [Nonomuraea sp. NBC_00507]|uniref:hypothetical protein n=1 Tax=Nonomuraea sp. NBC_00507 TaxID=2976002 RepID=UPI002E192156